MEAAMPCKMRARKRLRELQDTAASRITESNRKTKVACIVEAHESTRKRLESRPPKDHEDHIAEKGFDSVTTTWCTNLFRCHVCRVSALCPARHFVLDTCDGLCAHG